MLFLFALLLTFSLTFSTKIRARRATTLDPFFYDDEPLSFMKKSTTRDPIFEDGGKIRVEKVEWTMSGQTTAQFKWFSTPAPIFEVTAAVTTVRQPETTSWKSFFGSEKTQNQGFGLETTAKPIWKSLFGSALENEGAVVAENPLFGVETTAQPHWKSFFGAGTTTTSPTPISDEFELETTTTRPITTARRTTTVPWNSLVSSETTKKTTTQRTTLWTPQLPSSTSCLSPWFSHQASCYLIESDTKKAMRDAERQCQESGAHLFVPSTLNEFNQIMAKAPRDSFVWIGLFKSDEYSQAKWQLPTSISHQSIPWLLQRGYTDRGNGWKKTAQCAAMFNPRVGKYVFWFDCQEQYNFICQRKSEGVREKVDRFFE